MKSCLLLIAATLLYTSISAQKLKTGTYTFRFCDSEYADNNCIGTCKVVIKGDSITVNATEKLARTRTFTKEGDIIDKGIILKHNSAKWIVGKSKKDINAKEIGVEGPAILDFTKKQYWTF